MNYNVSSRRVDRTGPYRVEFDHEKNFVCVEFHFFPDKSRDKNYTKFVKQASWKQKCSIFVLDHEFFASQELRVFLMSLLVSINVITILRVLYGTFSNESFPLLNN